MQFIFLCISILLFVNHVVNCDLVDREIGIKKYQGYINDLITKRFACRIQEDSDIDGKRYESITRYSYSDFQCQKADKDIICLHLQKKIRVSHVAWDEITLIDLDCNGYLSPSDTQYEYFSMLKLNESREPIVKLNNCPLPETSYASLFLTAMHENKNSSVGTSSHIKDLTIYCQKSQDFQITKNHLEGLTNLVNLEITCEALKELPNDLFHQTVPKITRIKIHNSRLKVINDGLFRNLKKLEALRFHNNSIETISADAFSGSLSLSILEFAGNKLKYFSGKSICKGRTIYGLSLAKNQLNHFPKGLNVTESLDLSHNNLRKIERSDCVGLTKLHDLDLSQNRISSIDPSCFSLMSDLMSMKLSGNYITIPKDTPVFANKLYVFKLNDNSVMDLRISRYFISQSLVQLEMRNSNIISLEENSFEELPNLCFIDLSMNRISAIPVNLFKSNKLLNEVNLQKNRLTHVSPSTFVDNLVLQVLGILSNNLEYFSRNVIAYQFNEEHLYELRKSLESYMNRMGYGGNFRWAVSSKLGSPQYPYSQDCNVNPNLRIKVNKSFIEVLNVSHNNIKSLNNDIFFGLFRLQIVDISYNQLSVLPNDIFYPLKNFTGVKSIQLQGNRLSSLPDLDLPNLEYLDLSKNNLDSISERKFHKLPVLKHLDLSKNYLRDLSNSPIVNSHQLLKSLDLSHNLLQGIPNIIFVGAKKLSTLNLSHNRIKIFNYLVFSEAVKLSELNLSSNIISKCIPIRRYTIEESLQVLDLSNNSLVLNDTDKILKDNLLTLGARSPFSRLRSLEVLLLSNNSIENIFMDWRTSLPRLRHVDMRFNKIKYLTYHDMLFSSTQYYEDEGHRPYSYLHNTTLDLRNNEIRGIELPNEMLRILPKKNESLGFYGHVTFLLDDNPFECGCQVFNLLKVLHFNVALRSDLFLMYGEKKLLAAILDVGNLSCSTPPSIKGKKIKEIEEWIYHLLPMIGVCYLEDMLKEDMN